MIRQWRGYFNWGAQESRAGEVSQAETCMPGKSSRVVAEGAEALEVVTAAGAWRWFQAGTGFLLRASRPH